MLGLKSIVGTRVFKCAADTAGKPETVYKELEGIEETSGGGIKNNSQDYIPHDTGIKNKVASTQEYDDVKISVADTPLDQNDAYGESVVTILNDAASKREKFDLIKMVPAVDNKYKTTVWTGYVVSATTDDAKAENLQRGEFSFAVSQRKEFIGEISGNTVTLTPRSW